MFSKYQAIGFKYIKTITISAKPIGDNNLLKELLLWEKKLNVNNLNSLKLDRIKTINV